MYVPIVEYIEYISNEIDDFLAFLIRVSIYTLQQDLFVCDNVVLQMTCYHVLYLFVCVCLI